MHAVVVRVTINDAEQAVETLRNEVVPMASGAPGFVAGYWSRSEDKSNGMGVMIFESEDAARAVAERAGQGPPDDTVTQESVEVREVLASA